MPSLVHRRQDVCLLGNDLNLDRQPRSWIAIYLYVSTGVRAGDGRVSAAETGDELALVGAADAGEEGVLQ